MQLNDSSVMDTIPGVLHLLSEWVLMSKTQNPVLKNFCELLLKNVSYKFEYELNSEIYLVKEFYKIKISSNIIKNILFSGCWHIEDTCIEALDIF